MQSTPKTKLSYFVLSDWVRSMTKTTYDNGIMNRIDLVYIETVIELLGPIRPSVVCDENSIGHWHDQFNVKNKTEL